MYANVLLPLALPQTYTYAVPEELQQKIELGHLVSVTLRGIKYTGLVADILSTPPKLNIKYQFIGTILSPSPLILPLQLAFWKWIAFYYICSEGEVFAAAVPNILRFSTDNFIQLNNSDDINESEYKGIELDTIHYLKSTQKTKIKDLEKLVPTEELMPFIKKILDNKVAVIVEEFQNKYKVKQEKYVHFHQQYTTSESFFTLLSTFEKKPEHTKLLLTYWQYLKQKTPLVKKDVLQQISVTEHIFNACIKAGILVYESKPTSRITKANTTKNITLSYTLTQPQQQALTEITTIFESKNAVLLFGITGSGKTEIYAQLIANYLQQEKQILYLLPEIALTTQMIQRLENYFQGYVHVYHSKIGEDVKKEIWDKVLAKESCIILGARSSLFLPFSNLGLTIIDEEHDHSFKQMDPAPRYHARDAAIYFAHLNNSKVLLGSATPSLESLRNAEQDKIGLVHLMQRFNQRALPQLHIVDMTKVTFEKDTPKILSPILKEKIAAVLQANQQVIIFQNKRGYASYLICGACGAIPYCQHCDVSLTLHLKANVLKCHYCGTKYQIIHQCKVCKAVKMEEKKFATEQIEAHLGDVFPKAKTLRLDADTAKGQKKYEEILQRFARHEADILIGTQMIIKGLDFEHVALVGIVDGDALFNFTDFRVSERAVQTILQVSGRAGRKSVIGEVYLQLYNTKIPFIEHLIQQNYSAFALQEMNDRKDFSYPPHTKMIEIIFKHKDKTIVVEAAENFKQQIPKNYQPFFIGPSEPVIAKIKDKYLMSLIGKLPKDTARLAYIKQVLLSIEPLLHTNRKWRSVQINFLVDI